ncbi:MAG: glycosyltransferase family 4 protein [Burkholderiales bacterium]|nr:glycosyltransferase family 4 protein [Phycisphaerae bacterium]
MTEARLKIGLLTDNYPHTGGFGGIGSYTRSVGEELARRGHDVHIFTLSDTTELRRSTINGTTVWECPGWSKRRQMPFMNAAEFTLKYKADAVYLFRYTIMVAVRKAAQGGKFDVIESPEFGALGDLVLPGGYTRRFAVRLHGPANKWDVLRKAERALTLGADVVTTPTVASREQCEELWGILIPNAIVIGNPAKPPPPMPEHQPTTQSALFFGRLEPRKGVDVLAEAVGKVRLRHPNFHMIFSGKNVPWPDGRMGSQVIRDIADSTGGTGGYTVCEPPLSDQGLLETARRGTLCIFPSRLETFGLSFLEGMMWGVPTVVTDIPPFRELAEDGVHSLFARNEDADDLAAKICQVLDDPALAQRLGRNAQPHSMQWSVTALAPKLIDAWMHQ